MAYYFGINNGAGFSGNITEGTSTTGKDVEVVINTQANVPSKEELNLCIQKLQDYLVAVTGKNW